MNYPRLEIRVGVHQDFPGSDSTIETDVTFYLLGNRAEWSSADCERTGVMDAANVSLVGPHHATGKMSLLVEGWARRSTIDETATFQRWSLELG